MANSLLSGDEQSDHLAALQRLINVSFKNYQLLKLAFCHSSFSNESLTKIGNNERLEFLGDSVLGLVIADDLYHRLPQASEGQIAKIKAVVVAEDSLARIARQIGLPNCLLVGKGEELSGGRQKKAIIADCLEALIGAIYIDQGFSVAADFIKTYFHPEIQAVLDGTHQKDYKTLLQEYTQKHLRTYPKYSVVSRVGPDHAKIFGMQVQIGDQVWGPTSGTSKKEAEQAVAYLAWQALQAQITAKSDCSANF